MTTLTTTTARTSLPFSLKDIELHYVSLGAPVQPTYANGDKDAAQWTVQVRGLNEATALDLKELGVAVKYHEDTGTFSLTMKQYTQTKAGKANTVNVFNGDFEELSDEDRASLGYGSKGHVAGYLYPYSNDEGTGYAVRLTDVVVTEAVAKTVETPADRMKRLFG